MKKNILLEREKQRTLRLEDRFADKINVLAIRFVIAEVIIVSVMKFA